MPESILLNKDINSLHTEACRSTYTFKEICNKFIGILQI